jgi:hypothetical protein
VNKAKAVFDSPEKKNSNENSYEKMMREQEERAAIALSRKKTVRIPAFAPAGSPVQRRPQAAGKMKYKEMEMECGEV